MADLRSLLSGSLSAPSGSAPAWAPDEAPHGVLTELSGAGGRTTAAIAWVCAAQRAGDPVAWVQLEGGPFFPPDAAACGVDLDALVVVHVPRSAEAPRAAGGRVGQTRRGGGRGVRVERRHRPASDAQLRAAEWLLRSGAFGLVVVDLTEAALPRFGRSSAGWQGRLRSLSERYGAGICLLTASTEGDPSAGAFVGVRLAPRRIRRADGTYALHYDVLKDKIGFATGAPLAELALLPPAGLDAAPVEAPTAAGASRWRERAS